MNKKNKFYNLFSKLNLTREQRNDLVGLHNDNNDSNDNQIEVIRHNINFIPIEYTNYLSLNSQNFYTFKNNAKTFFTNNNLNGYIKFVIKLLPNSEEVILYSKCNNVNINDIKHNEYYVLTRVTHKLSSYYWVDIELKVFIDDYDEIRIFSNVFMLSRFTESYYNARSDDRRIYTYN